MGFVKEKTIKHCVLHTIKSYNIQWEGNPDKKHMKVEPVEYVLTTDEVFATALCDLSFDDIAGNIFLIACTANFCVVETTVASGEFAAGAVNVVHWRTAANAHVRRAVWQAPTSL